MRVDLGHDQRHVRVHPEGTRIVDDDRSGRRGDRAPFAGRGSGVLDKTISTPRNAAPPITSIGNVARKVTVLPATRSEARNLIDATGKARSSRRRIIGLPQLDDSNILQIELPWLYETRSPGKGGTMVLLDQPQHPGSAARCSHGYDIIRSEGARGHAIGPGSSHSRLFAATGPLN